MEKPVPHDALIKRLMEEPGFAEEFFDTMLPEKLKRRLLFESLRFSKDSFVDESLQKHFADAVFDVMYKGRFKNKPLQLSLLIEHKSSPDRFISLQILDYILAGLKHQVRNRPKGRTPYLLKPIIPIVIYHGKRKWTPKPLHMLFDKGYEEAVPYYPNVLYEFQSLMGLSDTAILGIKYALLKAALLTQKYSFYPDRLFSYLGLISKILGAGNPPRALFVYIFRILDKTYTKDQILEQIQPAMTTKVKSFYDKLIAEGLEQGIKQGFEQGIQEGMEKGIEKGIEKGVEKGLQEEKINTIHRMANLGFLVAQIAASVELPEEEVERILSGGDRRDQQSRS